MSANRTRTSSSPISHRDLKVVGAGALILLFVLSTATWTDSDLWGHTRFGLDMLRDHDLPTTDPYSFTQDKPWVNHEWLSELQMGLAYALAGPTGIALLKGTLAFTALMLMWGALRGIEPTARLIIFGAAAMSTAPVMRTLRPQAWSLVLLMILCRVLIEDRRRARWMIPVLLALWANLHGGWIVGFGILAAWTLGDLVTWRRDSLAPSPAAAISIGVLSILATLVTPYGWELWQFLVETVRMGRNITEWQPIWRHPPPDWVPWIGAVTAGIWFLRRPRPFRPQVACVLAMLAFSSLRVMRLVPLFVPCSMVLLSPWFRDRWPASSPAARAPGQAVADQRRVAAVLCAVAVIAAAVVGSKTLTCVRTEGTWVPDREAARVLRDAPPGRLVTFFDWGEYALWHLGPRLRVSMDGRRETVYSDTRLLEHDAIYRGTELGFRTLAQWKPEYVWLKSQSAATRAWLLGNGYRIDQETHRSFVAVRQDLPPLMAANGISASGTACFPD